MKRVRVGLVSDTHGLADPRLPELLAGCDLVLHAGDVVRSPVLTSRTEPCRLSRSCGSPEIEPPRASPVTDTGSTS